ncbi:Serine/threonine-protein kinase GRIK1 [Zostera marina]|uniref:non-specific serine/threonine protein kinase n=1 Tax=Zostera marina TaxID=29655 RepID=A0A0K9P521_ZOSMR|nr:Serine/threonine-protein kinase GRIK1 [Zostera marina]
MMFPDYDQEVRCCSCLGFLQKPIKSMDSLFASLFARDRQIEDADEESDSENASFSYFPPKDRPICRDVPVKETVRLKLDKDSDGKKTVNEYIRLYTIASGSYGKVVLYENSIDGKPYAIKAFYKSRLSKVRVSPSETAMTDVLREVSIMKTLQHPNIVNLIEVIDDPESDNLYLVLEFVDGKRICDASITTGGIGEYTSRQYLRDIIAGLMYLHAHNIIHGDIKPENLLVTKNGRVKIGDFGVSKAFEGNNDEIARSPGTPVFTAPECCTGSKYHGKAADTWALGVTLYCMIVGFCPFISDCLQDVYNKIVYSPLDIPKQLDPNLKDLLKRLLCKDPKQRISLEMVANHPWVVMEEGRIIPFSCKCQNENAAEESTSQAEKHSLLPT